MKKIVFILIIAILPLSAALSVEPGDYAISVKNSRELGNINSRLFAMNYLQDEFTSRDPGEIQYTAEEHRHRNHLALFLGTAHSFDHNTTLFAVGMDYELLFPGTSPLLGIGLIAEAAFGKHTEFLGAVPLFFHPAGSLKLFIAPGYIKAAESSESGAEHKAKGGDLPQVSDEEDVSHSTGHFLMRFGAGWDFHVGERFSISPTISADLVQVEIIWVAGVSFGIAF